MKKVRALVSTTALLVITLVAPARAMDDSVTKPDPSVCASTVLVGLETPKTQSGSSPKRPVSNSPKSVVGKESDGRTCPGHVHSVIPKVPLKTK